MEEQPITDQGASNVGAYPCPDIGDLIAAILGIRSPGARQHLRNARIEMLKAIRTVIDERIEYLSRSGARGTRIDVDLISAR